jgi:hypothetical protein
MKDCHPLAEDPEKKREEKVTWRRLRVWSRAAEWISRYPPAVCSEQDAGGWGSTTAAQVGSHLVNFALAPESLSLLSRIGMGMRCVLLALRLCLLPCLGSAR